MTLIPKLGKNPNSSLCEAFCLHRLCVTTSYIRCVCMRLCNPAWMHVCLYATTPTLLECGDLSVALCGKCSGRVATTCALHCTLKRAPVHLLLWQVWEIPAGWSWTPPRPLGLVQPVVMRNSEACTIANMRKEKKERSQKSLRGHSSP